PACRLALRRRWLDHAVHASARQGHELACGAHRDSLFAARAAGGRALAGDAVLEFRPRVRRAGVRRPRLCLPQSCGGRACLPVLLLPGSRGRYCIVAADGGGRAARRPAAPRLRPDLLAHPARRRDRIPGLDRDQRARSALPRPAAREPRAGRRTHRGRAYECCRHQCRPLGLWPHGRSPARHSRHGRPGHRLDSFRRLGRVARQHLRAAHRPHRHLRQHQSQEAPEMADLNPLSWWRRFWAQPNDSRAKTFAVAFLVAAVSAAAVTLTAVSLKPLQTANAERERSERMAEMLASVPGLNDILGEVDASSVETRIVDLASGTYAEDVDPATFDATAVAADS